MFKKLSEKIGFTQTEIKVTLLLFVIFTAGFSYKNFFRDKGLISYKKFDYTIDDSVFFSSGIEPDSTEDILPAENKDFVLELNKKSFNRLPTKIIAAEKSIDLNKANMEILTTLPGIGKKTAESIIELRNKLGKFSNFNELLIVKNIGNKKLAKIKKYAYIK
jgi:competence ComEA-like helix-hairpin-helix protein